MTVLVADVGGTNTRLALIKNGVPSWVVRYENVRHSSFYDILARYCAAQNVGALESCCVAIAGPVTSTRAQLTNLNWQFDVADIVASLPVCGVAYLVNDLVALGYALPQLNETQLLPIREPSIASSNTQALVVGIGTGFNACLVAGTGSQPTVIEAELGHASLPASVWLGLRDAIGTDSAAQFSANEDLFSGRGLSDLHRIVSDGVEMGGAEIVAGFDAGTDPKATRTVDLMAHLLGIFARELVFQYLPFGGINFAGGAARGILGKAGGAAFQKAFEGPGRFADLIGQVPVKVITDDVAALLGAAHFAASRQK